MGSILSFIRLLIGIGNMVLERNANRRRLKKRAVKEMRDGIKKRDPASVTRAFNTLRGL